MRGEINFLGGYGATNNPVQSTGAWQVRYMEGLGEHFAYSLSYVNQGTLSRTIETGLPPVYGSAQTK
jgi:hypothetical protein